MPQYGIKCTVGQKLGDMESSIIEHVISMIQIKSKHLGNVSRNMKHEGNQMPKNEGLAKWIQRRSTEVS